MTWSKEVTLWCDDDDCEAWTRHGASTVEETREIAKEHGWVYRDGEDLCPECK